MPLCATCYTNNIRKIKPTPRTECFWRLGVWKDVLLYESIIFYWQNKRNKLDFRLELIKIVLSTWCKRSNDGGTNLILTIVTQLHSTLNRNGHISIHPPIPCSLLLASHSCQPQTASHYSWIRHYILYLALAQIFSFRTVFFAFAFVSFFFFFVSVRCFLLYAPPQRSFSSAGPILFYSQSWK